MNYKITHNTTYSYTEPVGVCHNLVLLSPRDAPRMRCTSHRLNIRPLPKTATRRTDFFGNHVHAFSIEEPHRQMTITATSRVSIDPPEVVEAQKSPPWDTVVKDLVSQRDAQWYQAWPFRCESPRITRSAEYSQFAAEAFLPGRPVVEALIALTARIHQEFVYDPKATDVATTTGDAFALRKGVCQDFAHIQIACLRSLGISARYVSGYLRTEPPQGTARLVGADQSHAWVSVYCGSAGWIEVDPTNNRLAAIDHIPIAYGRDYGDVAPIRGVFLGGGTHALNVSVDVTPIDHQP